MTEKSCKSCRFLCTDSFISPCTHCKDEDHWVRASSIEGDIVADLIKQILGHVFPREKAIVKVYLDKLIAEVKGETK